MSQQQQQSAFAPMQPAYAPTGYQPAPVYGMNGTGMPMSNGAPYAPPAAAGFAFEQPPSYADATKKQQ